MNDNNEPIRVAQIIGKWVGGGVESVVINYYRHIDRSKIQFDFICDNDSRGIPYEEIKNLGGRVILVPPYQKVFKYKKELTKIFKENKYKIVHSHINTLSIFPLRVAKKSGVPVRIAHSHSTTNKKEWKKNLIKQLLRPFSKVYATDYFACTEYAGKWLFGDKEFKKGNIFILNNAIDLETFKYDEKIRNKKRRKLGIENNTLVIGHVGRFVEQKNHRFLIDIFNEIHKKNSNSVLILVGKGPLMKEVKEKVKRLKLTECVIFLGQINYVNEMYQAFDMLVLPSLYEGLGLVLVEAQCSGLPCVCSTEVPEIVKINNDLQFINLKSKPQIWSECILEKARDGKRISYLAECSNSGYDIKKEVKILESKYSR